MSGFKKKYVDTTPTKPEFSFSYSRLRDFETCPRRYYTVNVLKTVKETSVELERGNRLHDAMKQRVQNDKELPMEFAYMERWAQSLTDIIHPLQIINCELQLAVDRNLKPVGYWEKSAFCRTKIDYLLLIPGKKPGTFICRIVDYKTGKPKDDDTQLILNALCVLAHYKDVIGIKSEFLYTEHGDVRGFTYLRSSMQELWQDILPRVAELETAHANDNWPAKPCGLCREYCPVVSCEFYGKGAKR